MKKRIISMVLTLVMLLTSVVVTIPATAEETAEDLSALVADALAENDIATITLDAAVTSTAVINVPEGKTLTIEGSEKTYTAAFGFKASNGGALKVKNLNVVLTSTTVGYAESKAGGDLSFEGCTFSVTAATTRNGGMFTLGGYLEGVPTRISLKDCEIGVTAESNRNGQVFYSNTPNAEITLDGVKFDTSTSATKFVGFDIHATNGVGAKLTIQNGCDIKTGNNVITNYTDLTVEDSALASTAGKGIYYNGMSTTATALIKGKTVINTRYEAIVFQNNTDKSEINVTVEGDALLTAPNATAVVFPYKNNGKVNVTLGGNSVTQRPNGYAVCVQECTSTAETTFTVKDRACIKGKDAFFVYNNASQVKVNLLKNACVEGSRYALYTKGNSAAVSVVMSNSAYVYSTADRAVQADSATAPVSIELNDTAKITSNSTAIWAQQGTGHEFNLTLNDNSAIISKGYSISTYQLPKATITVNDYASIVSYNGGWVFEMRSNPTTITVADTAAIVYNRTGGYGGYLDNSNNITLDVPQAALKKISNLAGPTMLDGASIRIAANSNGLRFTSTVAKDTYIAEYGTIIVKNSDLGSNEFTIDALKAAGVTFGQKKATADGSVDNGDTITYNFALTNLPVDQLTTMFAARAYVIYDFNGYRVTVYSDFTEENVRSISMVAKLALEDVKQEPTDVEGEFDYIHKIEGVGYSQYTADQYAKIAEFVVAE